MGYVIFECSACGGNGYYIRDIDADGWEKWHGYYDETREHNVRKVGESDTDPTEHLSLFERHKGSNDGPSKFV